MECLFALGGREMLMADLAYVALAVAFFALAWLYVRACERV